MRLELRQRSTVPGDASGAGRAEAGDERGEGRLARAVLADERDRLPGPDPQRQVLHRGRRPVRIRQGDVVHLEPAQVVGRDRPVGVGHVVARAFHEPGVVAEVLTLRVDAVDMQRHRGQRALGRLQRDHTGGGLGQRYLAVEQEHAQQDVDAGDRDAAGHGADARHRGAAPGEVELDAGLHSHDPVVLVEQEPAQAVAAQLGRADPFRHEPVQDPQPAAPDRARDVGPVPEVTDGEHGPRVRHRRHQQRDEQQRVDDDDRHRHREQPDQPGEQVHRALDQRDHRVGAT
jgi:hypothetical protein